MILPLIRTAVFFLFMIIMLLFPEITGFGVRNGLLLWYQSIVPALFPFMVISSLIVSGDGITLLMKPVHKLIRHLIPISENGCFVLLSGLICGYPMGAKTCAEFLKEKRIHQSEGRFLMAVCNHPSPMFLFGFAYPHFKEQIPPFVFLLNMYLPLLILALMAKFYYFHFDKTVLQSVTCFEPAKTVRLSFDHAIMSSVEILCKIGGYLIFFSIIIRMVIQSPIIPVKIRLFLIGIMEMTTAIRELADTLPFPESYIASIGAISLGGLSGLFQVKSVISQTDIDEDNIKNRQKNKAGLSIRPYFFWKLAHTVLAVICACIICNYAS